MWLAYVALYFVIATIYYVIIRIIEEKTNWMDGPFFDEGTIMIVLYAGTVVWPFALCVWIIAGLIALPLVGGEYIVKKLIE